MIKMLFKYRIDLNFENIKLLYIKGEEDLKMTDRELLEAIASQVGVLTNQVGSLDTRMDGLTNQVSGLTNDMQVVKGDIQILKNDMHGLQSEMQEGFREAYNERQEMKTEIRNVKETVIKIEAEQKQKFGALFDGYKQNTDILEKIENEVSKHEDIILKMVQ